MSLTIPQLPPSPEDWGPDLDRLRCVACDGDLAPTPSSSGSDFVCARCRCSYPVRDGVLIVKDEPEADNRIVRDFYNSPLWPKFRFWEKFFWVCNGGERRSRNAILRHLPEEENLALLDVAIGDGVYLPWLPASWSITGIDISTAQLAACRDRNRPTGRLLRLALGEAETLPFRDGIFDAVLSIGGFNHFNDPEQALREMVRVVRPGGTIVISDELPNLTDRMLFRKLGMPGVDRWIVARLMNLGDEFTDLVERHKDLDIAAIGRRVLCDSRYEVIWRGGGYVMTGTAPC
jgi:ubiquinone/menaquinone biosynthesis C-methylase UbiE